MVIGDTGILLLAHDVGNKRVEIAGFKNIKKCNIFLISITDSFNLSLVVLPTMVVSACRY